MFPHSSCSRPGCGRGALTGSDTCFEHHPARDEYLEWLGSEVSRRDVIYNLYVPGIPLTELRISGKVFITCNFSGARIDSCWIRHCSFELCLIEKAEFRDIHLHAVELRSCVLAESRLSSGVFHYCDLLQSNFNGSLCRDVTFQHTDLLHSRFVGAQLQESSFRDCNLKEVVFYESVRAGVHFLGSNEDESRFLKENRSP